MKKTSLVITLLFITFYSFSQLNNTIIDPSNQYIPAEHQYWVEKMNDRSVNFYDVQQSFNEYFENKPTGKGTGWKQFKRWEWFTEQRVYPSGNREIDVNVWDEVMKFRKENPTDKSQRSHEWLELGPFTWLNNTGHWNPGMGRINVIMRDPNDPMKIYIGAPNAGLWRTTNEGETWEPLTDHIPHNSATAIAINPENNDIIYIGTGDYDMHASYPTYSTGVLKSTDGGETWEETGLTWSYYQFETISKLIINPTNPDILFAGTSQGVFKTTDAGETWYEVQGGDVGDMDFKPGNPDIVYASSRHFYKSTDGGETFFETTGVPTGSRVKIAVTEANPDYVYFFSAGGGMYRSEDSGDSFEFRGSTPNGNTLAWYALGFGVSHTDPEELHIGEFNTYRSLNGGQSWIMTTDWTWDNPVGYTHCDIHEIVCFGGTVYVGSDGLISKSENAGNTWINFSDGLNIRQFYRIGTSQNSPYKILGGSQDNGTSVYSYDYWHEWLGADGMEAVVDWSNDNIVYGTTQNGGFNKSIAGGNFGNVSIEQPSGGAWITPFVQHPTESQVLFAGTSQVRKTTNGMVSWSTIYSFGGGNINAMAIGYSNPDYLFASKSSTIHRTKDGSESWQNISIGLPDLYISYIAVHPSDPEIVAVSLSGYEEGEKVYISFDAGDTWENYSSNLPDIPANCLVFDDDVLNGLYVGMDVGIYYRNNEMDEWETFMNGLPNVVIAELEINYTENLIRAGTYGRGLWEANIHAVVPEADFEADKTLIPVGCDINFISLSAGPPETYEWVFEGGTPETSDEKNPSNIVYETDGIFDVTLTVTNDLGSSTETKEDYINVSSTLLPETDFIASEINVCSESTVEFYDLTQYCPNSWLWLISPASFQFREGTDANSQNPVVFFQEDGFYTVTLTAWNNNGDFTLTKEDYINVGGAPLPFSEDFESLSFDSGSWTTVDPDNEMTWDITEVGGSYPGNHSAYMNLYNYFVPPGQRDQLISPPINLTGYTEAVLIFEHAYAKKYASLTDSLIVYISADCGNTWTRIFTGGDDGAGSFATHTQSPEEFIPQLEEDWCGAGYGAACNTIDISAWTGGPNVKIMFESYSYLGNNLFVDNVVVTPYVNIPENVLSDKKIILFPNPTSGNVNIYLNDSDQINEIRIINIQGKEILSRNIKSDDVKHLIQLDMSSYPKGIYLVQVTGNGSSYTEKLILE